MKFKDEIYKGALVEVRLMSFQRKLYDIDPGATALVIERDSYYGTHSDIWTILVMKNGQPHKYSITGKSLEVLS